MIDYQQEQETAIGYFRKAIDLQVAIGQEENLASSLGWLANLYQFQGRYEEAESLYLQALELQRSLLGENHPAVATSLNDLAILYDSQGRYEETEPLCSRALVIREQTQGAIHPDTKTVRKNLELLCQKMTQTTS